MKLLVRDEAEYGGEPGRSILIGNFEDHGYGHVTIEHGVELGWFRDMQFGKTVVYINIGLWTGNIWSGFWFDRAARKALADYREYEAQAYWESQQL